MVQLSDVQSSSKYVFEDFKCRNYHVSILTLIIDLAQPLISRYRCVIVSLHPGPTDTDLSKPFQKSMSKKYEFQPAEVNVRKMMSVISSLQLEDSGSFLDYERHVIPF